MKSRAIIYKEDKFRVHSLTGHFDFDILFNELKNVYDDPNFDPDLNSVWDFSDVSDLEKVTPDQIQKIVSFVSWKRSRYKGMRTALVVSSKVHYGIARIYELSLESATKNNVMVFKNLDQAIDWIKSTSPSLPGQSSV